MEYSHVEYVRTPTTIVHSNKCSNILHVKFDNTELIHIFMQTNETEVLFEWIAATYAQETIRNVAIFLILRLRNTTSNCTSFTPDLYGMMTWSFTSQYNARIDRVVQSQTLLKEGQHKGSNRLDIGCLMSEL
eukprot:45851_1